MKTPEQIVGALIAEVIDKTEAAKEIQDLIDTERGDLREMFAAHAMQAILAMPASEIQAIYGHLSIAKAAFDQADDMLKVRKR
jgi:hypothetical protein